MNVRTRTLPAFLIAGAVLAGALLAGASPASRAVAAPDGTVAEKVKRFEEYVKTKPESQGLRNQIAELALCKDPLVVGALKPLLRHKDDEVKIAVAQNIGKQGDPKIAAVLMSMADAKDLDEENPKLMAALLEGIGDASAKANYDFLIKTAKKYLDSNADIASAAYRAASLHLTRDTVDDLIKELGRADYVTNQDNPVKKAARGACKPVLLDILKKVTGEQISDVKIWNEWWSPRKKTWKPPLPGGDDKKDLNASDEFEDSAYGFIIKKPSRAWFFRKPEGTNPYVVLEALDEGQRAAWVEVTVFGTKTFKEKTPEAVAEALKAGFEGKFRDIKDAEWEKKTRISGESAVEQIVFGQHKDFDAVSMHNVYVCKSEVMYQIITYWKSGKPQSLKEDVETIIKSFKLTR